MSVYLTPATMSEGRKLLRSQTAGGNGDYGSMKLQRTLVICIVLILGITFSDDAFAQIELDSDTFKMFWTAYFKNELSFWDRPEIAEKWGNFNKFRLVLEGRLEDFATFHVETDFYSFHGNNELFYSDTDTINLDRAYCDFEGELWNLRIGKQMIKWGPAKVWSPTDIFNPYDLSIFHDEERDGEYALFFSYQYSPQITTSAIITPAIESEFYRNALSFVYSTDDLSGRLALIHFGDDETGQRYDIASVSMKNTWVSLDYWFETALFQEKLDSSRYITYTKYNLGLETLISQRFYCVAEFFYDGAGHTDSSEYTREDWTNYLAGRIPNLGKVYSHVGVQSSLLTSYAVSLGFLKNYSDNSSYFYWYNFFTIYESLELTIGADWTSGFEGSEFEVFGNSYVLGLKINL